MSAADVKSPTSSMRDAYTAREGELAAYHQAMKLPPEAVGVAVFDQDRLLGIDVCDRHSTMAYFWESLVDSYAIEMIGQASDHPASEAAPAETQVVAGVLTDIAAGNWSAFDSPGEGQDWRLEHDDYAAASLVWDDSVVVHLQVFPKASEAQGESLQWRHRIRRNYGGSRRRP